MEQLLRRSPEILLERKAMINFSEDYGDDRQILLTRALASLLFTAYAAFSLWGRRLNPTGHEWFVACERTNPSLCLRIDRIRLPAQEEQRVPVKFRRNPLYVHSYFKHECS